MELEEMKALWTEMSAQMEKQKIVTDSIIIKMTQLNYTSKLNKIRIPEVLGSFGCVVFFLIIAINFQLMHTWYLQVCSITAALIFLLMPLLSLRAIHSMRTVNIATGDYRETLLAYSKGKRQFIFAQKAGFYLGAILMLVVLPVLVVVMGGKDIFKQVNVWYVYCIAYPIFYVFARWVFKKYMRVVGDAENILKELEG